LRDAVRPEFRIYTGNDLGINMIEYGSDYFAGAGHVCSGKVCGAGPAVGRGRSGYYALSDALQYLGNVAFREPVPAYKHSAAVFLQLTDESRRICRIREIRSVPFGNGRFCRIARGGLS